MARQSVTTTGLKAKRSETICKAHDRSVRLVEGDEENVRVEFSLENTFHPKGPKGNPTIFQNPRSK